MKDYLALLNNVPGVTGSLLCGRDGSIIENYLPDKIDADQVRKLGLNLHHGVAGLEEGKDQLRTLEFNYQQHLGLMWVTAEHLLLVLSEKSVNRAVLERSVTTLLEQLAQVRVAQAAESENRPQKSSSKKVWWVLIALLVAGAAGYFGFTLDRPATLASAPPPVKSVPPVTILRLQGSNTIGARLAPALAAAFLKTKGAVGEPVIEKSTDVETLVTATVKGKAAPLRITVSAHGSSTAFVGLLDGQADLGMASRPIKPTEVEKLAALGNLAGPDAEQVLAMDGLAIVIHPGNGLRQLTVGQLARLFSDQAADWRQLPESGLTGPVHVYARDNKSGTYDTFKHLILKPNGAKLAADAKRYEDSNQLSIDVSRDPQGIGFIGLPYIKPSKGVAVGDAGVRAIYPNSFTVATEDYPLSRRLFLYLPPNTDNPHARDFTQFALSEAGQQVVRKIGFIDLIIAEERISQATRENAPEDYRRATHLANRLSLNFRFLSGSNRLDSKGLQDIQRLVDFLRQGKNRNRGIRLLGFTDSIGNREQNCRLSLQRARAVGEMLNGYGVYPRAVKGLCEEMPIATNQNAAGREKNRRVEVWVDL
jgi:phosphate transport system substrate-binding protein